MIRDDFSSENDTLNCREKYTVKKDLYNVFVSHASDDKIEYVDDLVNEIKKLGITVFYDVDVISWGDDLKERIDSGLNTCSLAVIVISPSYFGREWTEYEIQTLLQRQNEENDKLILPILHRISKTEFVEHYPSLRNIVFRYSRNKSKTQLALEIKKELDKKTKKE